MGFFGFLRKKKKFEGLAFEGGPGDRTKSAVLIRGAPNHLAGVLAEYDYLSKKFGNRDTEWHVTSQTLLNPGRRYYDRMDIKLSDGTERTIFFEITEFFGKR